MVCARFRRGLLSFCFTHLTPYAALLSTTVCLLENKKKAVLPLLIEGTRSAECSVGQMLSPYVAQQRNQLLWNADTVLAPASLAPAGREVSTHYFR